MIGLQRGLVKLSPYNIEWKQLFEDEKARLQNAVGDYILDIQHVGSTSIPGMIAKPIIDIAVSIQNFEEAQICINPLEHLGYTYEGENGIPRRHFFVKGDPRTYHLHMQEIIHPNWENMVLFRDYFTKHPDFVKQYAQLKLELARRYPTDRQAYLDGKAPFIIQVLSLARKQKLHG